MSRVFGASYSNVEKINEDIMYVSRSIQEAALSTLPLHKPAKKQKKWYSDTMLSNLCKQKKDSWDKWKEAGCPKEGVLYEQRKALRDQVRKRIKICRANKERKRIEKIDHDFRNKHPSHSIPIRLDQKYASPVTQFLIHLLGSKLGGITLRSLGTQVML